MIALREILHCKSDKLKPNQEKKILLNCTLKTVSKIAKTLKCIIFSIQKKISVISAKIKSELSRLKNNTIFNLFVII